MDLFEKLIDDTKASLNHCEAKRLRICDNVDELQTPKQALILMKEASYELGGSGMPSVNYTCFTDRDFADGDEIILCGKDIYEITEDCAFARIAIVSIVADEDDTEKLYRILKDIEFVKYHVFPKGYMQRLSPQSNREQVRIGKKAVQDKLSFSDVGSCYINKYRENPAVKGVKLIFITDSNADFKSLNKNAEKSNRIVSALSKILSSSDNDCSSCSLKEICDEVEGLRMLHFKSE